MGYKYTGRKRKPKESKLALLSQPTACSTWNTTDMVSYVTAPTPEANNEQERALSEIRKTRDFRKEYTSESWSIREGE